MGFCVHGIPTVLIKVNAQI